MQKKKITQKQTFFLQRISRYIFSQFTSKRIDQLRFLSPFALRRILHISRSSKYHQKTPSKKFKNQKRIDSRFQRNNNSENLLWFLEGVQKSLCTEEEWLGVTIVSAMESRIATRCTMHRRVENREKGAEANSKVAVVLVSDLCEGNNNVCWHCSSIHRPRYD